ncbi:30S ribosomal protein S27ae [Candidatus Woesearchaeota archaeon]|nr:30S ribosomal protein S27ae [Candidatus Woesearchaeota archaeon]
MAKKQAKGMRRAKLYEVSGESLKRKSKFCPKCGPGVFMALHANRTSCGKCGYSEFKAKEKK